MAKAKDTKQRRAAEAWPLMFNFFMQTSPQRLETLQRRGLTPNDSRVLFALLSDGKPISTLARELSCDPSTATWLIDRLERLGLAERRASGEDRRVKLVALTEKGARSKREILREYHCPPPELYLLSQQELKKVIDIFRKLHLTAAPGQELATCREMSA